MISYNNRFFRTVENTANGQVTNDTLFHYRQEENMLWADYSEGGIRLGHLIGLVAPDGTLEFCYHHITDSGEIRSGHCSSKPEILADGRIRLLESWEWTYPGVAKGESIVEEIGGERPAAQPA